MPCTITPADLGPAFEGVDPTLAEFVIAQATITVLGPDGVCQVSTELAYRNCCIDPCNVITLLAQHVLATSPGSGGEQKDVLSERVGDVAVTYASAASGGGGTFTGSIYGTLLNVQLGLYAQCRARRTTMPFAVGGCA